MLVWRHIAFVLCVNWSCKCIAVSGLKIKWDLEKLICSQPKCTTTETNVNVQFLPRELCSRGIRHGRVSVCLSVSVCLCLSVTSRCSTKMAKHRNTQTTPHDSRMAPVLVTLNDLEGHSPVACLFKCNPSNTCAAFYQISTNIVLARSLSYSWASCFLFCCTTQTY